MKETICLNELPQIYFAHIFKSEKNYSNFLNKRLHSFEIGYIKSGCLFWGVQQETIEIQSGDIYFLSHNNDIKIHSLDGNEHNCFGFFCNFEINNIEKSFGVVSKNQKNSLSIKEKIDQLISLFNTDSTATQKMYAFIFDVINLINESLQENLIPQMRDSGEILYVNKAKLYIANNLSKEISLEALAKHLHLSVCYLCTIFKKITGETVITYINKQKISQLKNFITHYNLSLKEACSLVGIHDPSYASRLFKKLENFSLREFKMSVTLQE